MEVMAGNRLSEHIANSESAGVSEIERIIIAGEDDYRNFGPDSKQLHGEAITVHSGHPKIGEDEIKFVGPSCKFPYGCFRGGLGRHPVPKRFERLGGSPGYFGSVIKQTPYLKILWL